MGKYIDAEKLLAKIRWLKGINIMIVCEANKEYCRGYADAIEDILHTVASLQQERPEVDLDDDFVFDEIMSVYDSNDCLPPKDEESLEMLEKVFHHAFNIGYNTNK